MAVLIAMFCGPAHAGPYAKRARSKRYKSSKNRNKIMLTTPAPSIITLMALSTGFCMERVGFGNASLQRGYKYKKLSTFYKSQTLQNRRINEKIKSPRSFFVCLNCRFL